MSKKNNSSFVNFTAAIASLKKSIETPITEPRDISGIIKDFEIAYELSWKTLKKFLLEKGHESQESKDVFQLAYKLGYIDNESLWLQMIVDRNQTSHVYDKSEALQIIDRIKTSYIILFDLLAEQYEK